MATIQDNKKVIKQFFENYDRGDFDACQKLCDPSVHVHYAGMVDLDLKNYRQLGEMWRKAFPDMKTTIEEQIVEGDLVTTRMMYEATHKGDYEGIAATNKRFKIEGINIHRVHDGKITEVWAMNDSLGLLRQLGVTKVPELPAQFAPKAGAGYVNPPRH